MTKQTNLTFEITPLGTEAPIHAFTLTCPFEASVDVKAVGDKIGGEVGKVDLKLSAGESDYGSLGIAIMAALSSPVNAIVNDVALPILNKYLGDGFSLPSIDETFEGYNFKVEFVKPQIDLNDGYVLVGTNATASITKV